MRPAFLSCFAGDFLVWHDQFKNGLLARATTSDRRAGVLGNGRDVAECLPNTPPIQASITPFPAALPIAATIAVWKYNPGSLRRNRLNNDPTRRDGLGSDIASTSVME